MPRSAAAADRLRAAAARAGCASSRPASRASASAAQRTINTSGKHAELPPDSGCMRQEDLRGEHEHEPVAHRGGPLQVGEVAARHTRATGLSWIIVSSRCVSGLSTGCRPVSATATSANAIAPSASAGLAQACVPAVAATTPRRSVVPASERSDREREHERRLDEDRHGEITARAHQREAIARVPRRERRRRSVPERAARSTRTRRGRCPSSGRPTAAGTTSTAAVTAAATTDGARR